MSDTKWKVNGDWIESCNCQLACPCAFNPSVLPTEGECIAMFGWHVTEGYYGDITLDGLNTAMFLHTPGSMMGGGWKVALYVDDGASADQKEALENIFSGAVGGPLGELTPLIKETLGVKSVPIEYYIDDNTRHMHLSGMDVSITPITGADGGEVPLSNLPFTAVPGFAEVASESEEFRYRDYDYDVSFTKKNSFFAPFAYAN